MIYVKSDSISAESNGISSTKGQYDHFKMKSTLNALEDVGRASAEIIPDDKVAGANAEMEQLLRCIRCSPDWKHIASGDWTGNIRIHDLNSLEEI
jgi:WD40 repeat protein